MGRFGGPALDGSTNRPAGWPVAPGLVGSTRLTDVRGNERSGLPPLGLGGSGGSRVFLAVTPTSGAHGPHSERTSNVLPVMTRARRKCLHTRSLFYDPL